MNDNFFLNLKRQMKRGAKRAFLDSLDGESLSYADADRLSAQLANKLSASGLLPGDRVTAQIHKSESAVILYLACLRGGFVFHPLNTAYVLDELEHFLRDAKPSLLVCDPAKAEAAKALAERCGVRQSLTVDENGNGTLTDALDEFSRNHSVAQRRADDTAILIYTSGTTGKPKGAMITHENIRSNAYSLNQVWGWKRSDVLLHVLPLFHVHGLCVALHCAMVNASKIIFRKRFSASETVSLIPEASVLMGVPTIYARLLECERLNMETCQQFRLFISGSAPLRPETFDAFEKRTGHRILERYGMTEAGMIASNPLAGERIAGAVGYALPKVRLRIRDDARKFADAGRSGMLEISGPNVFKGYWDNPAATEEAFTEDGYFITGDMATLSRDGVLTIVGRQTDLIISAGFNIYPREIEIHLNQLPQISDSAVFGVPHPDLGEAVAAAIILAPSSEIGDERIRETLAEHLSSFKLPRKIVRVKEFPRNAMGKIEKKRLRSKYAGIFAKD